MNLLCPEEWVPCSGLARCKSYTRPSMTTQQSFFLLCFFTSSIVSSGRSSDATTATPIAHEKQNRHMHTVIRTRLRTWPYMLCDPSSPSHPFLAMGRTVLLLISLVHIAVCGVTVRVVLDAQRHSRQVSLQACVVWTMQNSRIFYGHFQVVHLPDGDDWGSLLLHLRHRLGLPASLDLALLSQDPSSANAMTMRLEVGAPV
jgi:hypothetical protein